MKNLVEGFGKIDGVKFKHARGKWASPFKYGCLA
jgi:hypothetical protein